MVTFANYILLWVSEIQTNISLSTLYSEYVALSNSVRAFPPLKSLTKEVINNLGIDSEKLKFVLRYNVYEDNNGSIGVVKTPRMTPTTNNIAVKYH